MGGAASGSATYSTSNFIIGLGDSLIQRNTVGKSFETAGIAWLEGLATGAVLGGLAMGLNSLDYGGNFWNGIITNDYLADGVVMYEHPNIRNFSGYDNNIAMEDNALVRRIDWEYGSDVIDEFGLDVTTSAPGGFTVDSQTGVYVNKKGEQIFGRVVHNPHVGSSNMYISPYAATHHDPTMFRAVTGHELTHAYHYYALTIPQNPNRQMSFKSKSERAALDYSYMEYIWLDIWICVALLKIIPDIQITFMSPQNIDFRQLSFTNGFIQNETYIHYYNSDLIFNRFGFRPS